MKKVLAVIAAIGCLSAASSALGGIAAGTGVNGSLHDMTILPGAQADAMERVCVYCHTPHHAIVRDTAGKGQELPLWNHKLPPDSDFTAYTWATPANEMGVKTISDPLAGPSRLCMSCHDGAIAIDQHGEAFDQAGGLKIRNFGHTQDGVGRANLTRDLSNTHPIGFDYINVAEYRNSRAKNGSRSAGGATEIVPATYEFATGITISEDQGTYNRVRRNSGKFIEDTLYNRRIMTCASCHEVHNKENMTQESYVGETTAFPNGLGGETITMQNAPNYFLYSKQSQSLICLSCHVK